MKPMLVGGGEEQARRLEEVAGREHDPYAAAHEKGAPREPPRVDGGQCGPGQDEAARQERDDAVEGYGVLNHDERPAPHGRYGD